MPPALATLYTDADSLAGLLSQFGVDSRLDDDGNGIVVSTGSTTETVPLTNAFNFGTSRVNDRALGRYEAADLATSWTAWDYATVAAGWFICRRRLNPNPLQAEFERCERELTEISAGTRHLADLGERTALVPGVTNFRLDGRYATRQLRVERPISDPVPTGGRRQDLDRVAEVIPDLPL